MPEIAVTAAEEHEDSPAECSLPALALLGVDLEIRLADDQAAGEAEIEQVLGVEGRDIEHLVDEAGPGSQPLGS